MRAKIIDTSKLSFHCPGCSQHIKATPTGVIYDEPHDRYAGLCRDCAPPITLARNPQRIVDATHLMRTRSKHFCFSDEFSRELLVVKIAEKEGLRTGGIIKHLHGGSSDSKKDFEFFKENPDREYALQRVTPDLLNEFPGLPDPLSPICYAIPSRCFEGAFICYAQPILWIENADLAVVNEAQAKELFDLGTRLAKLANNGKSESDDEYRKANELLIMGGTNVLLLATGFRGELFQDRETFESFITSSDWG